MSNIKDNWEKVLSILEKEVTAVSFDLWIKTLEPFEIQDNCLIIIASSETAKERCMSSHSTVLKLAIAESFDDVESFEILFIVLGHLVLNDKNKGLKRLNISANFSKPNFSNCTAGL